MDHLRPCLMSIGGRNGCDMATSASRLWVPAPPKSAGFSELSGTSLPPDIASKYANLLLLLSVLLRSPPSTCSFLFSFLLLQLS